MNYLYKLFLETIFVKMGGSDVVPETAERLCNTAHNHYMQFIEWSIKNCILETNIITDQKYYYNDKYHTLNELYDIYCETI